MTVHAQPVGDDLSEMLIEQQTDRHASSRSWA
jgi:hypothetical protein